MLPDTFFQSGEIPSRQIGAADRSREQTITDDGAAGSGSAGRLRQDEHDLPGGVAWYMPDLDRAAGKGQRGPMEQIRLETGHGAGGESVGRLYGRHFLDDWQVVLVADKGQVVDFLDGCRRTDMIEVPVGGQQCRQYST